MTKDKLRAEIIKIDSLSAQKLDEYSKIVSLSQIDDKARGFLYRAIEIRRNNILATVLSENNMAVNSKISEVS